MKIIECPRDAMQGLHEFVPTELKAQYINALLKVGFDTIDFGSFVSPKSIPQMKDTWKVLDLLKMEDSDSKLLSIVANKRGALSACEYEEISYLGYPFSISETFQRLNTNDNTEEAFSEVSEIFNISLKYNKQLVVYLSMCFGNPYGDLWDPAIVEHWADRFVSMGIDIVSLSDTVGIGTPETIAEVCSNMQYAFPKIEFGAHLHTEPHNWFPKINAAYKNGCTRFDGAINGFGGCPMAQNKLVGNMPTEHLISYFEEERADFAIDKEAFNEAQIIANKIFKR